MFLLILIAIIPDASIRRERCDVIEVNHFYCETDDPEFPLTHKYAFSQVIFRVYQPITGHHEVYAWQMLKLREQQPTFNHARQVYVAEWFDGGQHRLIEAKSYCETFTTHDPEVTERATWPTRMRAGLRKK